MDVKKVGLKQHSLDNRDLCNIPQYIFGVVWLLNKFKKRKKNMAAAFFYYMYHLKNLSPINHP